MHLAQAGDRASELAQEGDPLRAQWVDGVRGCPRPLRSESRREGESHPLVGGRGNHQLEFPRGKGRTARPVVIKRGGDRAEDDGNAGGKCTLADRDDLKTQARRSRVERVRAGRQRQ